MINILHGKAAREAAGQLKQTESHEFNKRSGSISGEREGEEMEMGLQRESRKPVSMMGCGAAPHHFSALVGMPFQDIAGRCINHDRLELCGV